MGFGSSYDYLVFDMTVDAVPSPQTVKSWLCESVRELGIETLKIAHHDFESPVKGAHAYTITAVLSASHMAVHTAPEHSWVQVAFALCDGIERREALTSAVNAFFRPRSMKLSRFRCGIDEDRS